MANGTRTKVRRDSSAEAIAPARPALRLIAPGRTGLGAARWRNQATTEAACPTHAPALSEPALGTSPPPALALVPSYATHGSPSVHVFRGFHAPGRHPFRPFAHRLPAHRRSPHGPVQLGLRQEPGRQDAAAH